MQIDMNKVTAAMRAFNMGAEADAIERGEAAIGAVCEIAGFTQMSAQKKEEDCGCTGKPALTSTGTALATARGAGGIIPLWNLPGAAPACYNNCAPVSECLVPLLAIARTRFDDHAWMYLWVKDPTVLHFDQVASAASGVYLAALPLTSNAKIIYTQQVSQQLPYLPGYFKFSWLFSGANAKDKVLVRIFTGPRGLTGLTDTTALTPVGDVLKLSDFDCHDDCYFLPYPDLLGCQSTGIPDPRAIYIELEAQALGGGGNQLDTLNMSMLKRGSKKYRAECGQYKLEMYGC